MSLDIAISLARKDFSLDLDLQIAASGVSAISGPSGSGKTSLLRVIAGLERNAIGSVHFNGQVWQQGEVFVAPQKRHIGYVFQHGALFEHLTVEGNIRYAQRRSRANRYSLSSLISIFAIEGLMHRYPSTLSGGEQQRVAIVRAFASQPDLLLLDEPLASLDGDLKAGFYRYLEQAMQQFDVPVLLVSHDNYEIARLTDNIVRIQQGQLQGISRTSQMLTDIHGPMANDLAHSSVLQGVVQRVDEQYCLTIVQVDEQTLYLPKMSACAGEHIKVVIVASDVSVHRAPAQQTSILNQLPTTIIDFKVQECGSVLLQLAMAQQCLLAQISKKSFEQLKISKGQGIIAQIKTVALA